MNTVPDTKSLPFFKDFPLDPAIQGALAKAGFEHPTEIQAKTLPILLSEKPTDFHGQAQTGTGKTLAFGLPLLHRIDRTRKETQALIVAPTRELAVQICESLRPMASAIGVSLEAIYGGVSMEAQLQKIRRGVQLVIGTPGRVLDHLRRGSLDFDHVKTLVLDEADIMLDMGFKEDIDTLLEELPEDRSIWLFSATVKGGIYQILKDHMTNPQSARVSKDDVVAQSTKHYFCVVPQHSRLNALCRFIECSPDFYGFIFCQTRILASQIAEQLLLRGYRVGALHGELSQAQRDIIIKRFRAKDISIVVATDVAARGIDVANLTHVVNFSLPEDQESYIHRSGRTGRAGKEGLAITFINKHELRDVKEMQRKFNVTIEPINVPDRSNIIAMRMQTIQEYVTKLSNEQTPTTQGSSCAEIVAALSEDSAKHIVHRMLYEMFLKDIDNDRFSETPTLDTAGAAGATQRSLPAGLAELTINVGSDDTVQREDITALFENKNIPLEAISKIRILKRCTFIHVLSEQLDACITALHQSIIGGRTVRASKVTEQSSGEYRGGGNRGGNGFRRNSHGSSNSGYRDRSGGSRRRDGGNSFGGDRPSFGERSSERRYTDRGSRPEVYQPHAGRSHNRNKRSSSGFGMGGGRAVEYSERE